MKRIIALTALALAGCDNRPEHAEWRMECVDSHTETVVTSMPIADGKGGVMIQLIPTTTSVCDREANVCVAGKDGSTECKA